MSKITKKTANKTRPVALSAREYIESVEHTVRRLDGLVLLDWFEKVTGFEPVMWGTSIVGFGRYHYVYDSGRSGDSLMTGFSPRKASMSVYIMPGYQDMTHHLEKLGKHKHGKSCLYINKLADVDLDVLALMVGEGLEYLKANYDTFER